MDKLNAEILAKVKRLLMKRADWRIRFRNGDEDGDLALPLSSVADAVAVLEAHGVAFKVIDAAGVEHGDLRIARRQHGKRGARRHDYRPLYRDWIDTIQIGDVVNVPVPTEISPEDASNAIGAAMHARYGGNSWDVVIDDDGLTVTRLVETGPPGTMLLSHPYQPSPEYLALQAEQQKLPGINGDSPHE